MNTAAKRHTKQKILRMIIYCYFHVSQCSAAGRNLQYMDNNIPIPVNVNSRHASNSKYVTEVIGSASPGREIAALMMLR